MRTMRIIHDIFMNGVFSYREKSSDTLIAEIYDTLNELEYYSAKWSKSKLREDRHNISCDINKALNQFKKVNNIVNVKNYGGSN